MAGLYTSSFYIMVTFGLNLLPAAAMHTALQRQTQRRGHGQRAGAVLISTRLTAAGRLHRVSATASGRCSCAECGDLLATGEHQLRTQLNESLQHRAPGDMEGPGCTRRRSTGHGRIAEYRAILSGWPPVELGRCLLGQEVRAVGALCKPPSPAAGSTGRPCARSPWPPRNRSGRSPGTGDDPAGPQVRPPVAPRRSSRRGAG